MCEACVVAKEDDWWWCRSEIVTLVWSAGLIRRQQFYKLHSIINLTNLILISHKARRSFKKNLFLLFSFACSTCNKTSIQIGFKKKSRKINKAISDKVLLIKKRIAIASLYQKKAWKNIYQFSARWNIANNFFHMNRKLCRRKFLSSFQYDSFPSFPSPYQSWFSDS